MAPKTPEKPPQSSLAAFADAQQRARFEENQGIARDNRALRVQLRETQERLAEVERVLDVRDKVAQQRLEPPVWLREKPKDSGHHGIPNLVFADPHWGAVVRPEEVAGINAYNLTIAEQRLKQMFRRTIRVATEYLTGVRYDGFELMMVGDQFSGNIHPELKETNAVTIAEAIVSLLEPLEAGINLLVDVFGKVHITAVPGNHSRITEKPRHKHRARDNYDWLLCKLLMRDFQGNKKVSIEASDSADARVQVYDTKYLLTHGDQFRGGSGISGALAPLLLGVHRKTRREAAAGRVQDVMVMGHFHQTLLLPSKGLMVGGSLMGYDEFAFHNNLEPERPQQAFWITTPEHGITFPTPIFVSDRQAEGW